VAGFIQTIHDRQPETPIVVITAIRSPKVDGNRNPAGMTLAEIRDEMAEAVHGLAVGDDNLHLVDDLTLLSTDEAEQLLPDGVHPSPEDYRLLADRLATMILDATD
jgi:lysophospholipase L1-like esterase